MDNRELCIRPAQGRAAGVRQGAEGHPRGQAGVPAGPKARNAAELAWVLAAEEAALVTLLDTGTIQWKDTPPPARVAESVAAFEKNAEAVNDRLAKLDRPAGRRRAAS